MTDIQVVQIGDLDKDDFYLDLPDHVPSPSIPHTPVDYTLERIAGALEQIAIEMNRYNEVSEV